MIISNFDGTYIYIYFGYSAPTSAWNSLPLFSDLGLKPTEPILPINSLSFKLSVVI